jgi:hypothetical protein
MTPQQIFAFLVHSTSPKVLDRRFAGQVVIRV